MKNKAIVALPLTENLQRDIRRASKETFLSQADVMRQSIRIGLPQFLKGFPKPCATPARNERQPTLDRAAAAIATGSQRGHDTRKKKGNIRME